LSLIDRGAIGGVTGEDVRIIFHTNCIVDNKGIDNHHVNNIGIGTFGGVTQTQHGPAVAIMPQYALLGKGASIHSPSQIEWYKNYVNDKSVHVPGGLQCITTLECYILFLSPLMMFSRTLIFSTHRPRVCHFATWLTHFGNGIGDYCS
jgi:hypothetical protein